MKYVELSPLPNDGYFVASNFYGILEGKILIGGGSGFIKPLAEGGPKLLSNSIRLITESNTNWEIHDQTSVEHHNEKYGFSNGASIVGNKAIYFVGGIKNSGDKIIDSSDIIKVWIHDSKIKYKIYENVLPFQGETSGIKISFNKAFISNKNNAYLMRIEKDDNGKEIFNITKIATPNTLINGSLFASDGKKVYIMGGYKSFQKDDNNSNKFLVNNFSVWDDAKIENEKLVNFKDDPCTFLGSSALLQNENHVLIVGGVNEQMFTDAIKNLSTLTGEKLDSYKKTYFNKSVKEFNFNNKLISLNLMTSKLSVLGEFKNGFAGNPTFIKVDDYYYILTAEIKAGVRLGKPIKIEI